MNLTLIFLADVKGPANWYEITKDIVIPSLSIATTIVLGTIIAILLKRKEEKAKIKALLIDTYMAYLNVKIKFFEYEMNSFSYEILKDIHSNYASYFEDHANRHLPIQQVAERRDQLKDKLASSKLEDHNWSPFTFKFCFLLSTKRYRKKAQGLENNIIKNYLSNKSRQDFNDTLKTTIKSNPDISSNMNTVNIHKINDALVKIENLISQAYASFQAANFMPYDNTIADMIDEY